MPNNGIFSLSSYYNKDVSGDIPEKSRETYREYGYFLGGGGAAFDRLDFSNDTLGASNRGLYPFAVAYQGATGNQNFGYVNGGYLSTTISRINYSNESTSLRTPTILPAGIGGACSNNNFGYFGGGGNPGGGRSVVQRVDYSNDLSTSTFRGPLSQNRFITAGVSNSNFGYFYGSRGATTIVDRINYSSDTALTLRRGNFQFAHEISSSAGNNFYGYWLGGSATTRVQRLDYANDLATGSIRGSLVLTIGAHGSATGNSNFGYAERGGGGTADIQRVDYSNDLVVANIRGKLSIATPNSLGACSSASFGGAPISQYGVFAKPFGYFGGGLPSTSAIDRIDYSNDTAAASSRGTLNTANYLNSATGNSNFGYFGGGVSFISRVDRLEYVNDSTTTLVRGPLSSGRVRLSATGNSNFGYFIGGQIPATVSTIDRINYSNDTSTASVRGSLTAVRSLSASIGTSNFGYVAGRQPGNNTNIERIDYSNDTSNSNNRSNLNTGNQQQAATGNLNFGYFGGGNISVPVAYLSIVERLDYSNDTTTTSVRGSLTVGRSLQTGATGTSNFGYFGGGYSFPAVVFYSRVDRIDYSNDLATASIRGPLSSAKYCTATSTTSFGGATDFQATSTFFDIQSLRRIEDTTNYSVKKRALGSFGYFGGGGFPSSVSTVNRIDYSNDTATASTRGPLSLRRFSPAGVGNQNFGYYCGGMTGDWTGPAPAVTVATVDRIDYSNDSTIALVRGSLTGARRGLTGAGNNNFGYAMGGGSPTGTNVDRIDYSNDNITASPRGNLKISQGNVQSGVGNQNFGYIAGSQITFSTISRITYANDLTTASIRGPLSLGRQQTGGAGNSNFGYFGGGNTPTQLSIVDRIDYSNDTVTASIRGPLTGTTYGGVTATGNLNFGYFGGGNRTTVDRINYSNDTIQASPRNVFSSATRELASTTNARNS